MTLFLEIDNEPRDYAWGRIDGVARVRGTALRGSREAELWLGAHPSAPSRIVGTAPWADLHAWEQSTGTALPFLLKILSADEPLSLQAHPSSEEAAAGFARENAAGVPLDAPHRNYRDPYAKPELIVALGDFEALCGFRAVADLLADLDALAERVPDDAAPAVAAWRERLVGEDGVRRAFLWLLSGDPSIPPLVTAAVAAGQVDERFALLTEINAAHPDDPGILGALMLQHITLRPGESLWLPAGNIHAYLRGTGIELMGPSDNVLRGGLTRKHIDTAELARVLDSRAGGDHRLVPMPVDDRMSEFRPEDAGFALYSTTGAGGLDLSGAAIALATEGDFTLSSGDESIEVPRGRAVFITAAAPLAISGAGRLFIAAGS